MRAQYYAIKRHGEMEERIVHGTFKNICRRVYGEKVSIRRLTRKEARAKEQEEREEKEGKWEQ